jgi:hypothetical protein
MALTLHFTRLSDDQHRFDYVRADGTGESVELESRSFAIHDLLHFAVEREAGLRGSFYGLLDRIGGYAELSLGAGALGGEMQLTQTIVGSLSGSLSDEVTAEALAEQVRGRFADMDMRAPRWLTAAFVEAVRERMGRLTAEWYATPPGGTMTLTFDVG